VKCWVKSRNERNPYPLLPAVRPGFEFWSPHVIERRSNKVIINIYLQFVGAYHALKIQLAQMLNLVRARRASTCKGLGCWSDNLN